MNRDSHQAVLHSLMGVALEHTTYAIPPQPPTSSGPGHRHIRTPAQSSLDSHLHTIRGTAQNVSNRFYDKTFTLIVDPSTRAGASGEHSPVDALVPSIVAEYGIVQGVDVNSFHSRAPEPNEVDGLGWNRLDWVADDKIWKECRMATDRANAIIEDSDDSVLWFENFGTDWIKEIGASNVSTHQPLPILLWNRWLQTFSRRFYSNGYAARVVPDPRRIYSNL